MPTLSIHLAREQLVKSAWEDFSFIYNFSAFLESGEAISAISTISADKAGLSFGGNAIINNSTAVRTKIGGGIAKTNYRTYCRVTTNLGNSKELQGFLKVEE